MTVSAVILAAGRSSRFEDGHKLLVEIDGVPIVRRVCLALAASDIEDIVLVVPEAGGPVAIGAGPGRWRIVENREARDGLSTSLRIGLENIASDADGVLVALADMPGVTTALVTALVAAFSADQTAIVFPVANDGRRGHPIIWPKSLFAVLKTVTGDAGGKTILAAYEALWKPLSWEGIGPFADIDTRADVAAFLQRDSSQ